jgi:PilZ domain
MIGCLISNRGACAMDVSRSRLLESQAVQTAAQGACGMGAGVSGFTARAPRFSLRMPVVFLFDEGEAKGYSVNISESGMLAVIDWELDFSPTGQLLVVFGDWHVGIDARVVRIEGCQIALAFQRIRENDRFTIQKLIERLNGASAAFLTDDDQDSPHC